MAAAVGAAIRASHRRREMKQQEDEDEDDDEDEDEEDQKMIHSNSSDRIAFDLLFVRVSSPLDGLCGDIELLLLFQLIEKRNTRIISDHQQLVSDTIILTTPTKIEGRLNREELTNFMSTLVGKETNWPRDFLNLRYSTISFLAKIEELNATEGDVNELYRYVCSKSVQPTKTNSCCSICRETFLNRNSTTDVDNEEEEVGEEEEVHQLPCSHQFHEHCIKTWLGSSRSCPLCRRHVLLSQAKQAKYLQSTGLLSNRVRNQTKSTSCTLQ